LEETIDSDELFDLKMKCLRSRQLELKAVLEVLYQADSAVVPRAVEASLRLRNPQTCNEENTVRTPYPPPEEPELREKIEQMRDRIIEIRALEIAGKFSEGLDQLYQMEKEAEGLGYLPVQAEIKNAIGNFLFRAGQLDNAEKKLLEVIDLAGKSHDSVLAARATTLLVFLVGYLQNRPREGEQLYLSAKTLLDLGRSEEPDWATLYNNYGMVLSLLNRYEEALEKYKKAIELDEKYYGAEHPNLAQDLGNLGLILRDLGEYEEARQYLDRAAAIFERTLGPGHPDIAFSYGNIGLLVSDLNQPDQAELLQKKALHMLQQLFGEKHSDTAWIMTNLAYNYLDLGRFSEAETYFEKALDTSREVDGPESPAYARLLTGKAMLRQLQGKLSEALTLAQQALTITETTQGKENLSTFFTKETLAFILMEAGRAPEAKKIFEEVLETKRKMLGENNRLLAVNHYGLGLYLAQQRKWPEAESHLSQALKLCQNRACSSQVVNGSKFELAKTLLALRKDRERAFQLAREALEGYSNTPKRFRKEITEINKWISNR